MGLIVQKHGGSSPATVERIRTQRSGDRITRIVDVDWVGGAVRALHGAFRFERPDLRG